MRHLNVMSTFRSHKRIYIYIRNMFDSFNWLRRIFPSVSKLKIHNIGVDKLGFIEAAVCRLVIFPCDAV